MNLRPALNELLFSQFAQYQWRCSLIRTRWWAYGDFKASRFGTLCALLEYRRRYMSFMRYPSLIIGTHKYHVLRDQASLEGNIPAIYVVELNDAIAFCDLRKMTESLDADFIHNEWVYRIPLHHFRTIPDWTFGAYRAMKAKYLGLGRFARVANGRLATTPLDMI